MGRSVASEIHVRVLGHLNEFVAEMRRGAREGIGGFTDEARASIQRGGSQKVIASQIAAESVAWKSAMQEVRRDRETILGKEQGMGLLFGGLGRMNARSSAEYRTQSRLKGMLPWGMSLRTELTREAAETAYTIEHEAAKLNSSLFRAGEGLSIAAQRAGLGRLGVFAAATNPWVMGGMAVGAVGGMAIHERSRRTEQALSARQYALMAGTGVEDASRLMATGFDDRTAAYFMRSLASDSKAFERLGLNTQKLRNEPLTQALQETSDAFLNMPDASKQAQTAMELFGRGAYELIPTLKAFRERLDEVRPSQIVTPKAAAEARRYEQSKTDAEELKRSFAMPLATQLYRHIAIQPFLRGFGDPGETAKMFTRWAKSDIEVGMADTLEANRLSKNQRKSQESERDALQKQEQDRLFENRKRGDEELARLRREDRVGRQGEKAVAWSEFEYSLRDMGLTYEQQTAKLAEYERLVAASEARDKDRALTREAESMRLSNRSPAERYRDELSRIDKLAGAGKLSDEDAKRGRRGAYDTLRDSFGLHADPLEAYGERMRQLKENRAFLKPNEFNRELKLARESTLASLLAGGQDRTVSPIAAMLAGSQAAHHTTVSDSLRDPQVALLREANQKLRGIEDKLGVIANKSGSEFTISGASK